MSALIHPDIAYEILKNIEIEKMKHVALISKNFYLGAKKLKFWQDVYLWELNHRKKLDIQTVLLDTSVQKTYNNLIKEVNRLDTNSLYTLSNVVLSSWWQWGNARLGTEISDSQKRAIGTKDCSSNVGSMRPLCRFMPICRVRINSISKEFFGFGICSSYGCFSEMYMIYTKNRVNCEGLEVRNTVIPVQPGDIITFILNLAAHWIRVFNNDNFIYEHRNFKPELYIGFFTNIGTDICFI